MVSDRLAGLAMICMLAFIKLIWLVRLSCSTMDTPVMQATSTEFCCALSPVTLEFGVSA
jgi:hypothetical protein